MIEKGKDMITIFCKSLLKRDQLFVLWVQRLLQQTLQLIFQVGSELIRIVIEGRRKLFFKFMRFLEHRPESNRPIHFVPLFKVFGLTFKMSRANLMVAYRGLKMSLPAIMNKDCFSGDSSHVFIDRSCAPVVRSNNIGGPVVLPCPEPMFLAVDFHTRFVCANNSAVQ